MSVAARAAPPDPHAALRADVLAGLAHRPQRLPSKYFYDARGSALFEAITRQPEYYLTRVERALLARHAGDIAAGVGPRARVVEYGSGSGLKTECLLGALPEPVAYTPVEISAAALDACVARLRLRFPRLPMLPLCADFTAPLALPHPATAAARTLAFFPGSTLGNFEDAEAVALLRAMAATVGEDGLALVGIDLVKDPAAIEAAYNDAAGVTAAFTLNLLARINRELGADFDLDGFAHRARYVAARERIQTHLVSRRAQAVRVAGRRFAFSAGQAILVEYSHKYRDARFAALAAAAGLEVAGAWGGEADGFGLRLLRRRRAAD
ncbi:L-histidine N(alpha)-methyltransferase [Pseudoxanthomonas broegbernensis]|uniref:L-histidine N(Alpha)-methyltransferase n=1 Tax=Pseudoxanthomonas broegbernensis TaxID=83619 RepID=A0A7V8K7R1_9GAMM|nr:L-histidine N(alpha)-methyltransferase [Pseudoxanthomonas broegbernensis]KAF1686883.1 L-histidine N(alpha)-methyltransferase [Pseudoxanthomonas broegbernensis]MBB6065524.1 dimethylhistidine N-methyltransferase [Pseudoxanthomonas broegbernensis]